MNTTYREPERDLPLVEHTDVIVCGGGPAGVAAALAAARTGARTRLIELHGCLGGVWTAGLLSWVIDSANKPGIMWEIMAELDRRGARIPKSNHFAYHPEKMKLVLEEMCLKAGVDVRLHTRVAAAARDSNNRLAVAITESKSGREAWAAKIFIDATGDGDLAAQAGCGFDLGEPGTGDVQPMTLLALISGIHADEVAEFIGGGKREPKQRLNEEMTRAGVPPSYSRPVLLRIRDDFFALLANHEYGVSAIDADQITAATLRARAEVERIIEGLRAMGGPWRDLFLVATADQIGVREGRRIHGRYTVSEEDLLQGARHEDAVCRVTFGIDVHSTRTSDGKDYRQVNRTPTQPYDIPLRALIARDVDGLLLAGRCISGDFIAHSSYRVTGNSVALGQGAGVAAALAVADGCLPQDLPWPRVEAALARLDRAPQPLVVA